MVKTRDSVRNTFLTTGLLCVICSVFVSASAVGLKSRQDLNKQLDKKRTSFLFVKLILQAAMCNVFSMRTFKLA